MCVYIPTYIYICVSRRIRRKKRGKGEQVCRCERIFVLSSRFDRGLKYYVVSMLQSVVTYLYLLLDNRFFCEAFSIIFRDRVLSISIILLSEKYVISCVNQEIWCMPICRINECNVIFFDRYKQLSISPLGLFFGQTNPIQYTFEACTMEIRLSRSSTRFNETLTNGQRPFENIQMAV